MVVNHNRSPYRELRWVEVLNGGSGTLAAHSVCAVISTARPDTARTVHTVAEPTSDSQQDLLVTGPLAIEVGDYGIATDANQCYAQISGSPSVGDTLGSVAGSTALAPNYNGWKFHGDLSGGVGRVMRVSGGTGTTFYRIRFTIASVTGTAPNKVATVDIKSRPCDILIVPGEVNKQVEVYDPNGCYFDESNAALAGRKGFAWYELPDGEDECQWVVDAICCPECPPDQEASPPQSSSQAPSPMITGAGPGPIPGQYLP